MVKPPSRFKKPAFSSGKGPRPFRHPKLSKADRAKSGYAKRHERKAKNATADDVYEYTAHEEKRAKIRLDVGREDRDGLGHDSDDEDADRNEALEKLRRRIGGEDEDGVVDSEDDEEIESDDAFEGESDEERFQSFRFAEKMPKGSKKAKAISGRPQEINLDEDEVPGEANSDEEAERDEEAEGDEDAGEDGDSDENMEDVDEQEDMAEAESLAASDAGASGEDTLEKLDNFIESRHRKRRQLQQRTDERDEEIQDSGGNSDKDMEDSDEQEEGDDDVADGDPLAASDAEASGEDALDKLDSFIESLHRKRKADSDSSGNLPSRKRRQLQERTEFGPEGEFGGTQGTKLQLNDLLAPLDSSGGPLLGLKKSAKLLASTGSKTKTLAAPLPQRTQDRLDREAAYEQTKEEVQKWAPTVKKIKEAEHLSFPLQAPIIVKPSTAQLTAKFKPSNELESAIDKLLKDANMREADVAKEEELKMKDLTVEEVTARRAELRQMRELMFRAEAKAKRVAKIKSKTYRRIQKKEREKNTLNLEQLEGLDSEAAAEQRMKMEIDRAKERATMRHKNTGKWAKSMLAKGDLDQDQRREITEQLERGELLRRKIRGVDEDESDGSDEDNDADSAEQGLEGITARAFDELAELDEPVESNGAPGKKSGLFAMKFMRDAMEKEQRAVTGMIDDFQTELERLGGGDSDEPLGQDDEQRQAFQNVQGNPGRVMYRPGPVTTTLLTSQKPLVSSASDTSSVTLQSSVADRFGLMSPPAPPSQTLELSPSQEKSNPWLTPRPGATLKVSRKKNEVLVSKDSSAVDKSKNTLKKKMDKSADAREKEQNDAVVEISMENTLPVKDKGKKARPEAAGSSSKAATTATTVVDPAYQDSDDGSDAEELPLDGKGNKAFKQRDLVALAFAGDNVAEDFAAQKAREVKADATREEDTTLPGWGSWGGVGTKKRAPNPKYVKVIPGVDPTKRADHGKAHVIISEKRDKKASKFQVKDLPFPYTSKAQFERSMDVPLGSQWNTRIGFQKGTLPRVVKKMGTVIDPLEKLF
ncbi:hypothetical protein BOTBODRAFT_392238 [Botryobasidium botryosum FD-172 SS1]|uniref:Utp14-domain-containing protein n=1 Tax=Botryobasidium botryosum (strain FD-172 SS1) TaxID=930990 RepID=A0A067N819_BOTB1|nr:hypothetical protein BOTBODRAFT_392238 [Botryobasidium botryosum FD-172 SS1]